MSPAAKIKIFICSSIVAEVKCSVSSYKHEGRTNEEGMRREKGTKKLCGNIEVAKEEKCSGTSLLRLLTKMVKGSSFFFVP